MDLLAGGAARTPGLVRRSAFWPLTPAPPPLAGLRVLVVEDEPFVRDSTRLVLEDAGACVAAAADGLEALAILQYEQFDVILCDVLMPRLDGPAFVRHLRQERGQAAPPVIAVSAFASHWSPRQVQQAGFAGYLAKPFEIPALMGAIAAARSRPAA
jgi:CheY-like chemotaxis protein